MQRRFESEPSFQATILLLQERIPKVTAFSLPSHELPDVRVDQGASGRCQCGVLSSANTPIPEIQLLSNGRYHVMVTNSGGGSSRWKDLAVTRWREDATCDYWGSFCYLRDVESEAFWSNTYQPTLERSQALRRHFFRRTRRIPPHAILISIRIRRLRSRPKMTSSCAGSHHQSRSDTPDNRSDLLCRGSARAAGSRRASTGFRESFCTDGNIARPACDSLQPAAALPERPGSLDVSSDGGTRNRYRGNFL